MRRQTWTLCPPSTLIQSNTHYQHRTYPLLTVSRIIDGIVAYLTLSEVGQLRLVCRKLGKKAVSGDYASNFHSRTVVYNAPESVHNFGLLVTRSDWELISSRLERITLAGRCAHAPSTHGLEGSFDARSNAMQELALALHRLHDEPRSRQDLSIVLAVHDTRPESPYVPRPYNYHHEHRTGTAPTDWRPRWQAASELFTLAVDTLAASPCCIAGFDVFSREQECALAIDKLKPALDHEGFAAAVAGLESLSLRLSQSLVTSEGESIPKKSKTVTAQSQDSSGSEDSVSPSEESSEDTTECLSKVAATSDLGSITYVRELLDICPMLTFLDIHWYTMKQSSSLNDIERRQSRFFNHLKTLRLAQLQKVNLAGFECRASALTAFARNHRETLRSVRLDMIRLYRGHFGDFFNCVETQMHQLQTFEFDNLYERHHPISFLVEGQPNTRSTDRSDGPNRLHRAGQDTRLPIQYRRMRGQRMGCPQLYQFLWSLRQRYGPPLAQ